MVKIITCRRTTTPTSRLPSPFNSVSSSPPSSSFLFLFPLLPPPPSLSRFLYSYPYFSLSSPPFLPSSLSLYPFRIPLILRPGSFSHLGRRRRNQVHWWHELSGLVNTHIEAGY